MLRIILISNLICLIYFTTSTSSATKYNEHESRPYEFGFKIENNQHRYEKRDQNGLVTGQFGFVTGDGIYHVTGYATDETGGFKIASMQSLKISEITDLFNIPRASPKPKFEIFPLKATRFTYNAVPNISKPNTLKTKLDTLNEKIVVTTKPSIRINIDSPQRNPQKPLGVGLPEKITSYREHDVTQNPIVPSKHHVEFQITSQPGIEDDYLQVKAPEDQTQSIRKDSITPTQSTIPSSLLFQPIPKLKPISDVQINTVKDTQTISQQQNINQQTPENNQEIQNQGVSKFLNRNPELVTVNEPQFRQSIQQRGQSKPIMTPSFQPQGTVNIAPELSQTSQPPLLDSRVVDQSPLNIKPTTEMALENIVRISNTRTQPQLPLELANEVGNAKSTEKEHEENIKLQFPQNTLVEQPISPRKPSVASQSQSENKARTIESSISNLQTQKPPIEELQIYSNKSPSQRTQYDNTAIPIRGSIKFSKSGKPQINPVEQVPVVSQLPIKPQVQFDHTSIGLQDRSAEIQPTLNKQHVPIHTLLGDSLNLNNKELLKLTMISQSHQPLNLPIDALTVSGIPSKSTYIQSNASPRESVSISKPQVLQNYALPQSLHEPTKPIRVISQNLIDGGGEPVQNTQAQILPHAITQPPEVYRKSSTPSQDQLDISINSLPHTPNDFIRSGKVDNKILTIETLSPITLKTALNMSQNLQVLQQTPAQQQTYKGSSAPSQTQFIDPAHPVQGPLQNNPARLSPSIIDTIVDSPIDSRSHLQTNNPTRLTNIPMEMKLSHNPLDTQSQVPHQNLIDGGGEPVQNTQAQIFPHAITQPPELYRKSSTPSQDRLDISINSLPHTPIDFIRSGKEDNEILTIETLSPITLKAALNMSQNLLDREEQPVGINELSKSPIGEPINLTVKISQNRQDRGRGPVENTHLQVLQQTPAQQQTYKGSSAPSQTKFIDPAHPVQGPLQNNPARLSPSIIDTIVDLPIDSRSHSQTNNPTRLTNIPMEMKLSHNPLDTQSQVPHHIPLDQPALHKISPTPSEIQFIDAGHPVQDPVLKEQKEHVKYQSNPISPSPHSINTISISTIDGRPKSSIPTRLSQSNIPTELNLQHNILEPERVPKKYTQPSISQRIPVEPPVVQKTPSTPLEVQFIDPVHPIPGLEHSIKLQLPIQKSVLGVLDSSIQSQVNSITASSINSRPQSNIPSTTVTDRTIPLTPKDIIRVSEEDQGKMLVIQPLSRTNKVRINLPKPLNSAARKLPEPTVGVLNEVVENRVQIKNKPAQSGSISLEPTNQFNKGFNTPKMEYVLGNILYRFNYTAGYHGHHEQGDHNGNKEGSYYVGGHNGLRSVVDYIANEDGYNPRVHTEYNHPISIPQEAEQEKGSIEFKWFYVR